MLYQTLYSDKCFDLCKLVRYALTLFQRTSGTSFVCRLYFLCCVDVLQLVHVLQDFILPELASQRSFSVKIHEKGGFTVDYT